jgi:F0F1-type ATP synthase assembly protein I
MSPSSLVLTLKEVAGTIIGFQSRLLAVAYILFAVWLKRWNIMGLRANG